MGPQRTSIPQQHSGTARALANTYDPDSDKSAPRDRDFTHLFDDLGRPGLQDQIGVIVDKAISKAAHIPALVL
jgi:hypothetical protein